ncbi:MAG: thiamine-phosphate kinase [Methylococcales bacterium]|nr:thiamine-phosphate kinase [Methylococcales bacterium]
MAISEFGVIEKYFFRHPKNQEINSLGIGDDCALMQIPKGYELAVTTDTMVEGVHFFAGTNPRSLGHKLLAVNLSDLAAMGAKPTSVTLALTLPCIDESWLKEFSVGFFELAKQYSVDLIGGDTTSGKLTLTIQAMGIIPNKQAMQRSTANVGDVICVTGTLGDAGLGLKIEAGDYLTSSKKALSQFHTPMPRIKEGLAIRGVASACIDLSDGIASDLKHILQKSQVGATVDWHKLPLSIEVNEYINQTDDWSLPLVAGEDYELCFTIPPEKLSTLDIMYTQIGTIETELGLRVQRLGQTTALVVKGFEHFSE